MESLFDKELTVAKPVAPEDLRSGSYVAILGVVWEHLPPPCDSWRERKPFPIVWLPPPESGGVLRIHSVCLPFVLAEQPGGGFRTLDVRRYRLALLSESFGADSFKALAEDKKEGPKKPE